MGKLLVFQGGPGTGKTTLAANIYNRAAEEDMTVTYETFRRNMRDDFVGRIDNPQLWVATTHGICYRLLKRYYDESLQVATAQDWKRFCKIKGIPVDIKELDFDMTHITDLETPGAKIYAIYSNCVNMMLDYDDWYRLPPTMQPSLEPWLAARVGDIIYDWLRYLDKKGLVDFPQMLLKTLELELSPPTDVYIADEFQDKTPIQYKLFRLWARDKQLTVVLFDKNQAIYNFWGTNPKFCDEVRATATKFYVMTTSYRISDDLYTKACTLLKISGQETFPMKCTGSTKFAVVSATLLPAIISKHEDVMILARTNYHLRDIAGWLYEHGIPFTGTFGWTTKMLRIYSFVWKYVNGYSISREEFIAFLKAARYPNVKFVKNVCPRELSKNNVDAFLSSAHRKILATRPENIFDHLNIGAARVMKNALRNNSPPREDVYLTTIHGAKGLQANTVVIVDGITRKIQDSIATDDEYKNECRVWYVAMTRAIRYCYLVPDFYTPYSISFLRWIARRWWGD